MVAQGISEYNENTRLIRGIHLYNSELNSDEEEALKEASESDIIIMCTGLDSSIEGEESDSDLAGRAEGFGQQEDKATIDLPLNQQKYIEKLIETGKKNSSELFGRLC